MCMCVNRCLLMTIALSWLKLLDRRKARGTVTEEKKDQSSTVVGSG